MLIILMIVILTKEKIEMHVFIVWKTIINLLLLYDIWY